MIIRRSILLHPYVVALDLDVEYLTHIGQNAMIDTVCSFIWIYIWRKRACYETIAENDRKMEQ